MEAGWLFLALFGVALFVAAPKIADVFLRYYNGPWPPERARHIQIVWSRVFAVVFCVLSVFMAAR